MIKDGSEERLPVELRSPPLVEVVFELRFEAGRPFTGDVLPGLLHQGLSGRYTTIDSLPVASLPREIRESDLGLRYQPHMRLKSDHETILVGHRVLAISKIPPYLGWSSFRQTLLEVTSAAQATGLLGSVERYAFKSTNIFDQPKSDAFGPLRVSLTAGDFNLKEFGRRARFEIAHSHGFTTAVDVLSDATAVYGSLQRSGLMLAIDTSQVSSPSSFWADSAQNIDTAHDLTKRVFFDLLQPATLAALQPVYGEVKP